MLLGIAVWLFLSGICHALQIEVSLDKPVALVEPEFVSVTIDSAILSPPKWQTFNFSSPRVHTLMRGLSPAYFRLGGGNAEYVVFSDEPDKMLADSGVHATLHTINTTDIDNIAKLMRTTNFKFLLDLNLQLRYGAQWNPTNAATLLGYVKEKKYDDVFNFELGNEPDFFHSDGSKVALNGSRIGKDFKILHQLLANYKLENITFVGPDCAHVYTNDDDIFFEKLFNAKSQLTADQLTYEFQSMTCSTYDDTYHLSNFGSVRFIKEAGGLVTASTFHHYYFDGRTAKVSDFINATHFDDYKDKIQIVKDVIKKSNTPNVALWLGEGSDAAHSGAPNISDKYASGFLWLEKLGLSAAEGLGVVMRQTYYGENYGLTDKNNMPNPDYWLSYIHKKLVGQKVLNVTVKSTESDLKPHRETFRRQVKSDATDSSNQIRVYAHCSQTSSKYQKGSITVFALNVKTTGYETLTFSSALSSQKVDIYHLTPVGSLTSQFVALNNKKLELLDDYTLPELIPVQQSAQQGIKLPALTFGFFVFPNAGATACK